MNLHVAAVIARNEPELTEVDFSTEAWHEWTKLMVKQGIDLTDHLPSMMQTLSIDAGQCLYRVFLDGRCIRDMWLYAEAKLDYVPRSGFWIPDTTIPPHDWMSPGRGEDAYWWWGYDCPYIIGITLEDLRNPLSPPAS